MHALIVATVVVVVVVLLLLRGERIKVGRVVLGDDVARGVHDALLLLLLCLQHGKRNDLALMIEDKSLLLL